LPCLIQLLGTLLSGRERKLHKNTNYENRDKKEREPGTDYQHTDSNENIVSHEQKKIQNL
jgi:hypothetical protein